jgi:hypothetical protein
LTLFGYCLAQVPSPLISVPWFQFFQQNFLRAQTRVAVCGYLAVAIVLLNISADRFYNLSHFHITRAYWSSSRGAMSGCVIAATADFALLYMIGLTPPLLEVT